MYLVSRGVRFCGKVAAAIEFQKKYKETMESWKKQLAKLQQAADEGLQMYGTRLFCIIESSNAC